MEITRNTRIEKIEHDDIVNLLSTALYGSDYLYAAYETKNYNKIIKKGDEEDVSFEDRLATMLLNGYAIDIYDGYAEGVLYGSLSKKWVEENEDGGYELTLSALKTRLEKCANSEDEYIRKCFDDLYQGSGDFDLCEADTLLQTILFDEVIYG